MRVVHLMASPFYGGPERQMLGLSRYLPGDVESAYLSFAEHGRAQAFLDEVLRQGYEGKLLAQNTPHFFASIGEVAHELRRLKADIVCCSGYKPDLIGWRAARRVGIPVVSVSHGWTGATWKVRRYEALDRLVLRWMDAVVCVSKAQGDKVRLAKVPEAKIVVIQNAIGADAFVEPSPECRAEMLGWFRQHGNEPEAQARERSLACASGSLPQTASIIHSASGSPRWIVGTAGRLSPEKGFSIFVEAAALVARERPAAGFVLFGDGPLRADLDRLIGERGLQGRFVMAGFRNDLHRFLPSLDLAVMSSFTEGLPVILLETGAAGVPTVATAVGGIPEVIVEGQTGHLISAGDAKALAERIIALLDDDTKRQAMGQAARDRVRSDFSFAAMGRRYHELFKKLIQ